MNQAQQTQIEAFKMYNKLYLKDIKPRDYQTKIAYEAWYKLTAYGICYLSMQMRTGKTLTSLMAASLLCRNNEHVLFVTKKKAIASIQNDLKQVNNLSNVEIINYESLHKVSKKDYYLIICDESHCLGSVPKPSERFKNLTSLIGKYTKLLMLSGTASPESFSQLYHQFRLSDTYSPFNQYKSFYQWAKDYVNVKQVRRNNGLLGNDYTDCNWDKLKPILDKYFIRYTQEQAGFELPINEQIFKVALKPSTYNVINTLKKDFIVRGKNHDIVADTKVKLLNKLHQLYSGTVIFEDGESMVLDTSKAEFIRDNFMDDKKAIFYKFKAEFDILKQYFPDYTECPEEFNKSNDLTFLGQLQSVKEGVNLSTADCLIFYNIDFSSVTYQQARERASHKNREKDNNVFFIFADNGIEQDIYNVLQTKQDYTLKHYEGSQISKNTY